MSAISAMKNNELIFTTPEFELCISHKVNDIWSHHSQIEDNSYESFGVLIGNKDHGSETYWIEDVTEPKPNDIQTRFSFVLKDSGHQKNVDDAFQQTGGKLIYLGTWHTHPQPDPHPSNIDYYDWKACIERNKDRQLFFIIVGTQKIALFHLQGKFFVKTYLNKDTQDCDK